MRTVTGLATHLAGNTHTRVRMLRIDFKNGDALTITDHDRPLVFDLGDGSAIYTPRTGILPSDYAASVGFDPDDMEVTGPLVETATEDWQVTKAQVIGGKFDDAEFRFFHVNWQNLTGHIPIAYGRVVLAEVDGGTFKLTLHSEISRFAQEIGRTITGYCDADFGDARCGYVNTPVEATVTAVSDARVFSVSFYGDYADDFFNAGTIQFQTGALAGTRPVEIFDWAESGAIALWINLPQAPEVGDTLYIYQGCGKTREACMAYDNIINFRGFPDVPGSDQALQYASQ